MKQLFTSFAAFGLVLGAAATLPLDAASAQQVRGIGVVNVPAVVANSNAYRTAQTQRQTTYAAQIQQANARGQAIQQQLAPLIQRFNTDRQAANPNQQALQQQATRIQQIQQSGEQEIQTILQPIALSNAYVEEQIGDRLRAAIEAAAKRRNVSLVLTPEALIWAQDEAYNMNQAVTEELNRLLPTAQLVPPAGWQPRAVREAQAAQATRTGTQQPAPASAAPAQQPTGR